MSARRNWSGEKSGQGMSGTCRSVGKSRDDRRRRQGALDYDFGVSLACLRGNSEP